MQLYDQKIRTQQTQLDGGNYCAGFFVDLKKPLNGSALA